MFTSPFILPEWSSSISFTSGRVLLVDEFSLLPFSTALSLVVVPPLRSLSKILLFLHRAFRTGHWTLSCHFIHLQVRFILLLLMFFSRGTRCSYLCWNCHSIVKMSPLCNSLSSTFSLSHFLLTWNLLDAPRDRDIITLSMFGRPNSISSSLYHPTWSWPSS